MSHARAPLSAAPRRAPLLSRAVLLFPERVEEGLERAAARGLVPVVPNVWQVTLGVLRMWHRVLYRFDSVGMSREHPVRPTPWARFFHPRPLRFPFLVWERAIAPLDFSGLVSTRERVIRHLLAAHHDGDQFVYDLELLTLHDGALEELLSRAREVLGSDSRRARWLKDLTVFEGYHEALVHAAERALVGDFGVDPSHVNDPDITLSAYLRWCAKQPASPEETLRAFTEGRFTIADGLRERDEVLA